MFILHPPRGIDDACLPESGLSMEDAKLTIYPAWAHGILP
jgi:hypothetical protein